jgi:hypothetical protein
VQYFPFVFAYFCDILCLTSISHSFWYLVSCVKHGRDTCGVLYFMFSNYQFEKTSCRRHVKDVKSTLSNLDFSDRFLQKASLYPGLFLGRVGAQYKGLYKVVTGKGKPSVRRVWRYEKC